MSDEGKKSEYDVLLADHEYDGIQEYNNPAPFWWQLFFYLSIAFAIGYYVYSEFGTAPSSDARLATELAEVRSLQNANRRSGPDEKTLLAFLTQPEILKNGRTVFSEKCSTCHAPDGGGLVGPNLTDAFWLHGKGSASDIFKVVSEGVADKGMPSWGPLLSAAEVTNVVVYVKSLQGTRPASPKAPQGTKVE